LMGVVANVLAAWRHRQLVRQLDRGEIPRPGSVAANLVVALVLALVGFAMAVYLVTVGTAPHARGTAATREEHPMDDVSTSNGIARQASPHTVDETVERLRSLLESKGVRLFALVDHSGEAE